MAFKFCKIFFLVVGSALFYTCKSSISVSEIPQTNTTKISEKQTDETENPEVPTNVSTEEAKEIDTGRNLPPLDVHEFRAAWVATVANINWPSKPGLSTSEQQREALKLLDSLEALHFNAVIVQVRPQADALYNSDLEPWSYFLTGEQGKAPDPYYDPLKFWINAAHDRDLELHAWLNPYRAYHTTGGAITDKSIIKTNPELVVELENGMWWMDPAIKGTQDRTAAVVKDLVERYDLDGIHFDDYFYPYDSYNGGKDFPDDQSWKIYQNSGGELSRGDWRREEVNSFVQRIYKEIKKIKPHVKFGISPFGIWKPGFPKSITGYNQYEKLFADAKLWLNEGWVDYFSPQLYWKINQYGQSFPELLGWWSNENYKDRHLWPGIRLDYGGGDENSDETINQIMITRGMLPESKGTLHWSIAPLMNDAELAKTLVEGPYIKRTLVPASPWLVDFELGTPKVITLIKDDDVQITWSHPELNEVYRWVLYFKYEGGNWDYKLLSRDILSINLQNRVGQKGVPLEKIGITAVDRVGNESEFHPVSIND